MSEKTGIQWTDATASARLIPGFSDYAVTEDGLIFSLKRGTPRLLKALVGRWGHLHVYVYRHGQMSRMRIHHAVLLAFDRAPEPGEQCRHLDGNPANNRRSNLAWGTAQENSDDKRRHDTLPRGERSGNAKLTEAGVLEIRRLIGTTTLRALGKQYGVSHTAIRRAANGMKWAYLGKAN